MYKNYRTKINSLAVSLVWENVNNSKLWNFVFQKREHLNKDFGLIVFYSQILLSFIRKVFLIFQTHHRLRSLKS